MAFSTRAGSLVSASAAPMAASHIAGGVKGDANWAGGCCFVRARARPGISKRQINSRGIDAFVHENGVLTSGLILPNGTVRNVPALFGRHGCYWRRHPIDTGDLVLAIVTHASGRPAQCQPSSQIANRASDACVTIAST